MNQKRSLRFSPILLLSFAFSAQFLAGNDQGKSGALGYNNITCLGGSDTLMNIPFTRHPVFVQKVGSVQALGNGTANVVVQQVNVPLTTDEFGVSTHFLRFTSGALSGQWFDVTGNQATSVVLNVGTSDLSGAAAGDDFEVIPYWTLGTIWPAGNQDTIHVSTGKLPPDRMTSVLFADETSEGIDLAPDQIFFLESDGWYQSTNGFPSADDVTIHPGQTLVIRHPAIADGTIFVAHGLVDENDSSKTLRSNTITQQDNPIGLMRPVPVSLSELDLSPEEFVDSLSEDRADHRDYLLVYSNATDVFNRQPTRIFIRINGEWRRDLGDSFPAADNNILSPSTPIVIRKYPTQTGEPIIWTNLPHY